MKRFTDEYTLALADYVSAQPGLASSRAAQLGRKASAEGMSASAMLNVHYQAEQLLRMKASGSGLSEPGEIPAQHIDAVSVFFRESLAAYEAANAQLTRENYRLQQMNETLEMQASRFSRALDGDAGQLLTAAHLKLDYALRDASPECAEHLMGIRGMLHDIEHELRRISHQLQPAPQDEELPGVLESLIKGVAEREGLRIEVHGARGLAIPKDVETILYPVVQEALTNVVKHAGASAVSIDFRLIDGELTCTIADNGAGFDPDRCRHGTGLFAMRQRLQSAGGKLVLKSEPGSGAELRAEIPLKEADSGRPPETHFVI